MILKDMNGKFMKHTYVNKIKHYVCLVIKKIKRAIL